MLQLKDIYLWLFLAILQVLQNNTKYKKISTIPEFSKISYSVLKYIEKIQVELLCQKKFKMKFLSYKVYKF